MEQKCVDLANWLLLFSKETVLKVRSIKEIDWNLIVLLFENIISQKVPDLVICQSKEDEAHNVQSVIDTLSLDLIGISLSHITGEDIVGGKISSIYNLLEVFEGLVLHMPSTSKPVMKRKTCRKRSRTTSSEVSSQSSVLPKVHCLKYEEKNGNDEKTPNPIPSTSGLPRERQSPEIPHGLFLNENSAVVRPSSSKARPHFPVSKHQGSLFGLNLPASQSTDKTISRICRKVKPSIKIEKANRFKNSDLKKHQQVTYTSKAIKRKSLKQTQQNENQDPIENKQQIEDLYDGNFTTKVQTLLERHSPKPRVLKRSYIQNLRKPFRNSPIRPCKKSYILPHTLRHTRSRSSKRQFTPLKNSAPQGLNNLQDKNSDFIKELFEEFPGLELSPNTVDLIKNKYRSHLLAMHKKVKNSLLKKSMTQIQAEEAAKKQQLLSNLLQKDMSEQKYLKDVKEKQKLYSAIKYQLRDSRLQSAKMKQYCDEFRNEMRKKMTKRNFAEELVIENLFRDALKTQKEQVDYLCQEMKEADMSDARQHLIYLEALDNLYQNQFSLISEALIVEKQDVETQLKAQEQEHNKMKRDFQEELKHEIRFMQQAILECTEDIHFRELDAEQYRMTLRIR